MAEDSEQDENEYLFSLLEMITGNQPGKEVWEPIIKWRATPLFIEAWFQD